MFHKIKDIKPLKEDMFLATFEDGTVKTYDLSCDELWDNDVSYEN